MTMETLETLLKEGTGILADAGIKEAGLDAWLLLEYKTKKSRAYYYAHSDEAVDEESAGVYRNLIRQRAKHIPLQHLTHQAFFMGYEFYVDEHVLVPRQDTETLVEEALKVLKDVEAPHILDMCTGSGCILLSLILEKEGAKGVGADVSPEAVAVAKRNAKALGVEKRVEIVESNLFSSEFLWKKDGNVSVKYDILISNPPYIKTEEIEGLMEEVRVHDPRLALDGKEDGLFFYREITRQAEDYIKQGGWLFYEIGYDQGKDVSSLMENAGFEEIRIIKDLAGLDRVVCGRRP
jgi:release factor glutamine methyltransferase